MSNAVGITQDKSDIPNHSKPKLYALRDVAFKLPVVCLVTLGWINPTFQTNPAFQTNPKYNVFKNITFKPSITTFSPVKQAF